MYLKSLQIKNYRGIKHAAIVNLSDTVSILYGKNAVGKSVLLDSLACLRECISSTIEIAIKNRRGIQPVFGYMDSVSFTALFVEELYKGFSTEILYELELGFDLDNGLFVKKETVSLPTKKGGYSYYFLHRRFSSMERIVNESDIINHDVQPIMQSFEIDKHRLGISQVNGSGVLFRLKQFISEIFVFNLNPFYQNTDKPVPLRGFNKHSNNLQDLIEYFKINKKEFFESVENIFKMPLNFPLNTNSTGVISLYSNMALMNEGINRSMICIDCPETGIQETELVFLALEYIEFSKSTNTPLLIVTGSFEFISMFEPTSVFVMSKENDNVSINTAEYVPAIHKNYYSGAGFPRNM